MTGPFIAQNDDRYPMTMTHPAYRPAVLSRGDIRSTAPGSPARYPPVVVNNADQEEYHVSRGYVPTKRQAAPAPPASDAPAIDPKRWPRWETLPSGTRAIVKTPVEYREIFGRDFDPAVPTPRVAALASVSAAAAVVDADEMAEFRAWKAAQEARKERSRENLAKARVKRRQKSAQRREG